MSEKLLTFQTHTQNIDCIRLRLKNLNIYSETKNY